MSRCSGLWRMPSIARLALGVVAMIREDALWLCALPLDMRAGVQTLLERVIDVFGVARPSHAYLFANRHGTRMKVLVCDINTR